jgi:hypothetical protein
LFHAGLLFLSCSFKFQSPGRELSINHFAPPRSHCSRYAGVSSFPYSHPQHSQIQYEWRNSFSSIVVLKAKPQIGQFEICISSFAYFAVNKLSPQPSVLETSDSWFDNELMPNLVNPPSARCNPTPNRQTTKRTPPGFGLRAVLRRFWPTHITRHSRPRHHPPHSPVSQTRAFFSVLPYLRLLLRKWVG